MKLLVRRYVACLAVGCLAVAAGCRQEVEIPQLSSTEEESAEFYLERAKALTKKTGAPVRVRPKAFVPQAVYDFGVMDPQTSGVHEFVVRNEGSAPLTLEVLDTSCKCTVSDVSGDEIPPGGAAKVRMEWNTGSKVRYYQQWSRVATNDPAAASLTFEIKGTVRQELRFEPEELHFGTFLPTETVERELLVFSPNLDDFVLETVTTSREGFVTEVSPAPAERLAEWDGRRGYLVKVQVPGDLNKGDFTEFLQLRLKRHAEQGPTETFELALQGRVMGRLAVIGPAVDDQGRIDFGVKRYGEGAKAKLRVKVRDDDPTLNITDLRISPGYLKVSLTPNARATVAGLYDLDIELPRETEPCAHRGDAAATVRFEFDHPRIPKLELKVDFSVRPEESLTSR